MFNVVILTVVFLSLYLVITYLFMFGFKKHGMTEFSKKLEGIEDDEKCKWKMKKGLMIGMRLTFAYIITIFILTVFFGSCDTSAAVGKSLKNVFYNYVGYVLFLLKIGIEAGKKKFAFGVFLSTFVLIGSVCSIISKIF